MSPTTGDILILAEYRIFFLLTEPSAVNKMKITLEA
jgi:hypothetical protein